MAPTSSRRTAALAAGGALVVLGIVVAVVMTRSDPVARPPTTSSASPSSPALPPRPSRAVTGTRFGAVPEGVRSDYQAALARADQTLGELQTVRVYYGGAPEPWPGKAPGRNVVVSFKLPPQEVVDGAHDASMRAWFASAPRDLDVDWVYQHEPEDDVGKNAFTAAQFRDAFAHLSTLAREVGNPRLQATLILQSYTLKPRAKRDWHEFYPGDAAVDIFAWDVYNRPSAALPYASPEQLIDGPRGVSESVGKRFAIGELGSIIAPGDDGGRRADWLRAVGGYVKLHNTVFVAYFDVDFLNGPGGENDYRLRDPASLQAWREIAQA